MEHPKIIKSIVHVLDGIAMLDDEGNILKETELNLTEEEIWDHIIEAVNKTNEKCTITTEQIEKCLTNPIAFSPAISFMSYRYLGHYFKKDIISLGGSMNNKQTFDWLMVIIMEREN